MRVKLPAAPAALVPNSMSHVDRGNGGVVEWAPETLCRRASFVESNTCREENYVQHGRHCCYDRHNVFFPQSGLLARHVSAQKYCSR